jgi:hypothetical protein
MGGKVVERTGFPSTREGLNEFLDGFMEARFIMESTGIWEFIYQGIEAGGSR